MKKYNEQIDSEDFRNEQVPLGGQELLDSIMSKVANPFMIATAPSRFGVFTLQTYLTQESANNDMYKVVKTVLKYESRAPSSIQALSVKEVQKPIEALTQLLLEKFGKHVEVKTLKRVTEKDGRCKFHRDLIITRVFAGRIIDEAHAKLLIEEFHKALAEWRKTLT